MLDRLTDSDSLTIRVVALGGLLLAGSFNLTGNLARPSKKVLVVPVAPLEPSSDELERNDIGKIIMDMLSSRELTPKEEAEACEVILTETKEIDPNEDPINFLESIQSYQGCRSDLSIAAANYLGLKDFDLEVAYFHLMRCTPHGEEFRLEDLERCEVAEDNFADFIDEQMLKWGGLSYDHEYFEDYREETLYDEKSGWLKPGHAFRIESEDGAYEGTFQFSTKLAPNGEVVLDPSMVPQVYGADPQEIMSLYRPRVHDSVHEATSRFYHSAQEIQTLSGSEK